MANKKIFSNQGPSDPDLKKSTFDLSYKSNATFRFGRIYPAGLIEAPANSSYNIGVNFAFDLDPLVFPIQTNVRAHIMSFKIPFRILWKNYKNFFSQVGTDGMINGQNSYSMPYIKRPTGWVHTGSLADYMGLPTERLSEDIDTTFVNRDSNDNFVSFSHFYATQINGVVGQIGKITPSALKQGSKYGITYGQVYKMPKGVQFAMLNNAILTLNAFSKENVYLNTGKSVRFTFFVNYDHAAFSNPVKVLYTGGIPLTVSTDAQVYNGQTYYQVTGHLTPSASQLTAINNAIKNTDCYLCMSWDKDVNDVFHSRNSDLYDFVGTTSTTGEIKGNETQTIDASSMSLTSSRLGPSRFGIYNIGVNHYVVTNGSSQVFDSVNGADPKIPINALPFRAYEFIYRYFFENQRVSPFYKNGQPVYNEYITNDGDGADDSTPVGFFNAPYEFDMFTTCTPQPFSGNAPLVGVSSNGDNTATFNMVDIGNNSTPYTMRVNLEDGTDKITGISFVDKDAKTSTIAALQEAISYGISIADFRNINALTKFQERAYKAGTKYQNLVQEFFGTNPPIGEEFPVYIGGVTRDIIVDKITNTAQSEGNPLGDFAGQAVFRGSSKRIHCFCSEPSYIFTIIYFSVTPTYSQLLPKHFIKSKLLDYYNPLFANISLQPVYAKELAPLQLADNEIDATFGYNRPYADYVSRQDEAHGEFRTSRANFILQRRFGSRPQLNKSFLEIDSNDLTDIFSYTEDTDKIFGQIGFDIKAKLPIPKFSIPQII